MFEFRSELAQWATAYVPLIRPQSSLLCSSEVERRGVAQRVATQRTTRPSVAWPLRFTTVPGRPNFRPSVDGTDGAVHPGRQSAHPRRLKWGSDLTNSSPAWSQAVPPR